MKRILSLLLLAAVGSAQVVRESYRVWPLIGAGSKGDGGPAVSALLDGPAGLAEDTDGNIYISESNAGVIRLVRPNGVIERFAGTGKIANGAAEKPALETDLLHPTVLAVAPDGGLFFTDPEACRIRKVLTDGTIRNLIGTGVCGGTTGGFPGGSSSGTADRRPEELVVSAVGGMVVDSSGRLVYTDETSHVVRRLDSDGYVRVIAGVGSAGFSGDDDSATDAYLNSPRGLAFDEAGNLYVADSGNCRVRRINTDGIIATVAGNGTCTTASTTFTSALATSVVIGALTGLAYEKETYSLLIASPGRARLLRLDLSSGRISSVLGDGLHRAVDTTSPQEYSIDQPNAVLVSPRAGILVADTSSFAVVQLQNGKAALFAGFWPQLNTYPSAATAPLVRPRGLCLNPGGPLLVVDAGAERILSFLRPDQLTSIAGLRSPTGYSSGDNGPAVQAQIADPDRVACAPNGDVYLTQGSRIRVINQEGIISTVLTAVRISGTTVSMLSDPAGLVIDSAGRLLISEAGAHRVVRYDLATRTSTLIAGTGTAGFRGDGGAATDARLDSPGDLAFDSTGNLLIADRGNNRVRRVSPDGTIQTIAGSSGTFSYVNISGELATDVGLGSIDGLAVDSKDNIYISEYSRISVVDKEGRIYIVTGFVAEDDKGVKSYIDGPLNGCDGLAVDSDGRLYFSAREDGRVIVAAPKSLHEGVVSNTSFGGSSSVAPGTWVEIYGADLAGASRQWSNSDFTGGKASTSLDGVRVVIGGQDAFVAYISPSQVNAQVPSNVGLGQQQVTVMDGARTAAVYTVTVNATQPGLFAPSSFKIGERQYMAAVFPDGSTFVAPSGAIPGAASRPARPGETIVLYGIGFGPVTPSIDAGEIVQEMNALDLPIQFFFSQTPAEHFYAGLVATCMGLYQFNVIVPAGVSGDAVPLSFTLGGASGEQTLFVAIQR